MNLDKEKVQELNALLKDVRIDIPPFRREVTATGANYNWLRKHITLRNKELSPRVLTLLELDDLA